MSCIPYVVYSLVLSGQSLRLVGCSSLQFDDIRVGTCCRVVVWSASKEIVSTEIGPQMNLVQVQTSIESLICKSVPESSIALMVNIISNSPGGRIPLRVVQESDTGNLTFTFFGLAVGIVHSFKFKPFLSSSSPRENVKNDSYSHIFCPSRKRSLTEYIFCR